MNSASAFARVKRNLDIKFKRFKQLCRSGCLAFLSPITLWLHYYYYYWLFLYLNAILILLLCTELIFIISHKFFLVHRGYPLINIYTQKQRFHRLRNVLGYIVLVFPSVKVTVFIWYEIGVWVIDCTFSFKLIPFILVSYLVLKRMTQD